MRDHLKLENDELREKLALNEAVRSALEHEVELKRLREENERLKAQEAERKKRFAGIHSLAAGLGKMLDEIEARRMAKLRQPKSSPKI
jgi:hypothetical protein